MSIKDFFPSFPADITIILSIVMNGNLYFTVHDNELWKSDGTEAGTILIKEFEDYSYVTELTAYNGEFYFRAKDSGTGYE
ncbi:MAG: hyalin, partial [Planctomycetes bacterium]|nr:hyalin [Planctomycetota bacterium]